MKQNLFALLFICTLCIISHAQNLVVIKAKTDAFPIVTSAQNTSVCINTDNDRLVHKAASSLSKNPGLPETFFKSTKQV